MNWGGSGSAGSADDQGYQPFWAPKPKLTAQQEQIFNHARDYHSDGHIVDHAVSIKGRQISYDKKAHQDFLEKHARREAWKRADEKKKQKYDKYLLDREERYRVVNYKQMDAARTLQLQQLRHARKLEESRRKVDDRERRLMWKGVWYDRPSLHTLRPNSAPAIQLARERSLYTLKRDYNRTNNKAVKDGETHYFYGKSKEQQKREREEAERKERLRRQAEQEALEAAAPKKGGKGAKGNAGGGNGGAAEEIVNPATIRRPKSALEVFQSKAPVINRWCDRFEIRQNPLLGLRRVYQEQAHEILVRAHAHDHDDDIKENQDGEETKVVTEGGAA